MGNDHSQRACGGPNPLVVELRSKVDVLESDLLVNKEQVTTFMNELREQRERSQRLEEERDELRKELENCKDKVLDLETEKQEILADKEKSDAALTFNIEERDKRINQLQEQVETLEASERHLQASLDRANEENDSIRTQLESKEIELMEARNAASDQLKKSEDAAAERASQLQESVSMLQRQRELDAENIANLEFQISNKDAEIFGLRTLMGQDPDTAPKFPGAAPASSGDLDDSRSQDPHQQDQHSHASQELQHPEQHPHDRQRAASREDVDADADANARAGDELDQKHVDPDDDEVVPSSGQLQMSEKEIRRQQRLLNMYEQRKSASSNHDDDDIPPPPMQS